MLNNPVATPVLAADVQAYLHETLGTDTPVRLWSGAKSLPYFLQDAFDIHELQLRDKDILLYTLSARRTSGRPPVHYNADFEEIIHYFKGPGAWGPIAEPGTLTWVPKGVSHHGPTEDVPAGYLAFLLELRSTPRITEFAKKYASIMTGTYEKFRRDQY